MHEFISARNVWNKRRLFAVPYHRADWLDSPTNLVEAIANWKRIGAPVEYLFVNAAGLAKVSVWGKAFATSARQDGFAGKACGIDVYTDAYEETFLIHPAYLA